MPVVEENMVVAESEESRVQRPSMDTDANILISFQRGERSCAHIVAATAAACYRGRQVPQQPSGNCKLSRPQRNASAPSQSQQ